MEREFHLVPVRSEDRSCHGMSRRMRCCLSYKATDHKEMTPQIKIGTDIHVIKGSVSEKESYFI